jgi:hypothetical protein
MSVKAIPIGKTAIKIAWTILNSKKLFITDLKGNEKRLFMGFLYLGRTKF